jgi:hypothetical protein
MVLDAIFTLIVCPQTHVSRMDDVQFGVILMLQAARNLLNGPLSEAAELSKNVGLLQIAHVCQSLNCKTKRQPLPIGHRRFNQ